MATKNTAVATAMAIAVLAVSVAALDSPGPRSYLASWRGPGCTSGPWPATMNSVGACGCNGIFFSGGYEFNFRGETATLYTGSTCTGDAYRVFEDTRACGDFVWHSIHIDC